MKKLSVLLLCALVSACDSDDDDGSSQVLTQDSVTDGSFLQGLQSGQAIGSVAESAGLLETALNNNPNLSLVAQVDHQSNAANNNLELRPTRVTLFGNPALGTPLMQINQLAGLDLPQKMLIWEDEAGQSFVAYNSADYLNARYELTEVTEELTTINGALSNLAGAAAGQAIVTTDSNLPESKEGIITVESENDMATTIVNLRNAIEATGTLTTVTEVDHSANATSVNQQLNPTYLFIFGNPNLGTPLMQSGQSIGIDLPQKMLVFENGEGFVSVAYNDPSYLAERHGIDDQQGIIATVTNALANLAAAATAAPQ